MNGLAGSPYYIGKGHGKRAFTKHGNVPLPKDKSKIVILLSGMTEDLANAEEKRLIAVYGRIDRGTGCLRNRTDGGEGQCGVILSEERKRFNSEWMKAHPNAGNEMTGCRTPEARAKAAASNTGKKRSAEYRQRRSESQRGILPHCAGWNKGIPRTEEQKAVHSVLLSGRKQSPEAVAKRAEANRASSIALFGCAGIERRRMRRRERYAELHQDEEKRHGNLGRKASEETKRKMSESQRARVRPVLTHCKNGHPRTPENIRPNGKGCGVCHREWASRKQTGAAF